MPKEIKMLFNQYIFEYYEDVIMDGKKVQLFCNRCGTFGHHNVSKECIFYNLEFEETETALIVSKCLDEIINMISK